MKMMVWTETGRANGFLMGFSGARFLTEDKSSPDPHGFGTEHKRSSKRLSIKQTSSSNNLYLVASHRTLLALDHFRYRGDDDSCRHIAGMSAPFTTLSTDHINADVQTFLDMLGVAYHVHIQHASFV